MRTVAGSTAVPPAGDRGVQRRHQEEGGGGGTLAPAATVLAVLALATLALAEAPIDSYCVLCPAGSVPGQHVSRPAAAAQQRGSGAGNSHPASRESLNCLLVGMSPLALCLNLRVFPAHRRQRFGVAGSGEDGRLRTVAASERRRCRPLVTSAGQLEPVDQQQHRRGTAGLRESPTWCRQSPATSRL